MVISSYSKGKLFLPFTIEINTFRLKPTMSKNAALNHMFQNAE